MVKVHATETAHIIEALFCSTTFSSVKSGLVLNSSVSKGITGKFGIEKAWFA